MPVKEIIAESSGDIITVRNTWFSGAALLINGEIVDRNNSTFATDPGLAFLLHRIDESRLIEVFVKAVFTIKIKICVNKNQIGGDVF